MKHTDLEMIALKEQVKEMWKLVISQVTKAKKAILENDAELALEVISQEKRVNAFELKIESDCENYIALYSPVAIDLRLALSLIKIANNLERIGDFARGMAYFVVEKECELIDLSLVEQLSFEKMIDTAIEMLLDGFVALESENTKVSNKIIGKDTQIDEIYRNAFVILSSYITENPTQSLCGMKLLLVFRKIERIGDHCNNIIEDIVFYVDAKVLKHGKNHSVNEEESK